MDCYVLTPSYIESLLFFFFNDTATTEIYTLSLHDALPISIALVGDLRDPDVPSQLVETAVAEFGRLDALIAKDRKSTRLNSSHSQISYAVFCLKKKEFMDYGESPEVGVEREAEEASAVPIV